MPSSSGHLRWGSHGGEFVAHATFDGQLHVAHLLQCHSAADGRRGRGRVALADGLCDGVGLTEVDGFELVGGGDVDCLLGQTESAALTRHSWRS